jgi:hypothetical protein
MSVQRPLAQVTDIFTINIQGLRVFNERIGRLAEEYDRTTFSEFLESLTSLLGVEILPQPKSADSSHTKNQMGVQAYKDVGPGAVLEGQAQTEESSGSPTDEDVQRLRERFREMTEDPEKARRFILAVQHLNRGAPGQGLILRRGALVALVSYLEALFSELIQSFYLRYPAALPAESRLLSLSDLREIGSVEEAERYLIMKEVDSVLREGLEQQLRYFSDRLKVDMKPLDPFIQGLVEVFQRRNLVVHNGGVVNRTYLKNVWEELIKQYGINEGQQLSIDKQYLSNAIDNVCLCGVILSQQCWKKWEKKDDSSDDVLHNHIYESLAEERYDLVINLARFTDGIKLFTENARRMITINHAIAWKELGNREQMEEVLSKHDWSACAIRFTLALHALRAEEEEFFNTLSRAIAADEIGRHALEEWPLFKAFRGMARFQAVIESCVPVPSEAKGLGAGEPSDDLRDSHGNRQTLSR